MVSWSSLPTNSAEAAAEASFRIVTCPWKSRPKQADASKQTQTKRDKPVRTVAHQRQAMKADKRDTKSGSYAWKRIRVFFVEAQDNRWVGQTKVDHY